MKKEHETPTAILLSERVSRGRYNSSSRSNRWCHWFLKLRVRREAWLNQHYQTYYEKAFQIVCFSSTCSHDGGRSRGSSLAEQEEERFKQIFDILDTTSTGHITVEELKECDHIPSSVLKEVENTLEQKITFKEFCSILRKIRDDPSSNINDLAENKGDSPDENDDAFFNDMRDVYSRFQSRRSSELQHPNEAVRQESKISLQDVNIPDMTVSNTSMKMSIDDNIIENKCAELEVENNKLKNQIGDLEAKLSAHDSAAKTSERRLTMECNRLKLDTETLRAKLEKFKNAPSHSRNTSHVSAYYLSRGNESSYTLTLDRHDSNTSSFAQAGHTIASPVMKDEETSPHVRVLEEENKELKKKMAEMNKILLDSRDRVRKLEREAKYKRASSKLLNNQLHSVKEDEVKEKLRIENEALLDQNRQMLAREGKLRKQISKLEDDLVAALQEISKKNKEAERSSTNFSNETLLGTRTPRSGSGTKRDAAADAAAEKSKLMLSSDDSKEPRRSSEERSDGGKLEDTRKMRKNWWWCCFPEKTEQENQVCMSLPG
eukprot:jgi/Bigna1/68350/fgenesh1_pg.6_\